MTGDVILSMVLSITRHENVELLCRSSGIDTDGIKIIITISDKNLLYINRLCACHSIMKWYVFCAIYVRYIASITNSLVFRIGSYNNFGK